MTVVLPTSNGKEHRRGDGRRPTSFHGVFILRRKKGSKNLHKKKFWRPGGKGPPATLRSKFAGDARVESAI